MFDPHLLFIPYQTLKDTQPVQLTIKRLDQIHPQILGEKDMDELSNTTFGNNNKVWVSSPPFWCLFQIILPTAYAAQLWFSKYWHHSW